MTQKDAVVKALQMLGGRSHLKNINVLAVKYIGNNTNAKQVEANIRRILNSTPSTFRHAEGLPNGWWELVSYQEEVAALQQEIADLKSQLAEKDKVIEELKKVPTEDDFVKKLIIATKTQFRFKRNEADAVRQVMDKLGRSDADADLTAWMEGRENKPTVNIGKLEVRQGGTNIDTNYGPNIEQSGGTLSLPDGIVATPLPESEDKK
jgi:uncharacterized coiled-coil protein SlyX